MRFTIFSRLVAGYLAIFIMAIILSIYVNLQFQKIENVSNSILNINNRIINNSKKLIDALLSQIEYEKKFIIMKDNSLYEHFITSKIDFDQYLEELVSIADSPHIKNLLDGIKQSHQRYLYLFFEEVDILRKGQRYSQKRYTQEKEKAINSIMEGLKELKIYNENNTYEKITKLNEAGADARRVAIIITILSLFFGIAVSIAITQSITKPLTAMRKQTREIAKGNYKTDLNLLSPPEIRELAQDFNFMCDKLKEIDKIKSDFFSFMSHELRTPLTSIKEGTNLLLEGIGGKMDERQNRLLTIIRAETNRLIKLVNSLLDLSKMESGLMSYNFSNADLTYLIKRALTEIEPLTAAKNIRLEAKVRKGLPLIKVDSERILQVLRNLLSNAVKFTPANGQIKVYARTSDQGVEVSVSDSGVGISKENLATIFNKFQQVTNTTLNSIKGTGLGLAIVKHIISAHGGKIWVESEPGLGSTFTFLLPA